MQKMIYVLKLQDNRFFVYFSESKKDSVIMRECTIYYDYVKKYKPLFILETFPFKDFLEVDRIVKHYMYNHGYEYVRGGSYIDDELPNYLVKTLNHEFDNEYNDELDYIYLFKEILTKYEYNDYTSIQEINREIDNVNKEFAKYISEKEKLENTKYFYLNGEKKNLNNYFTDDITWLYHLCTVNMDSVIIKINTNEIESILTSNYVTKYKNILIYLKQLYILFVKYDLFSKYGIENSVYLQYPEFLFDGFIYNSPHKDKQSIFKIYKTFLFMGNVICNMLMEQDFDINSYGLFYEWRVSRILYILESKKENLISSSFIFREE
jgi:hypothetical protein